MRQIQVKEIKPENLKKEITQRVYKRLIAIAAVDEGEKLAVYYHFDGDEVETLKVTVPEKNAKLPTSVFEFPSAEIYERETHDFFGIEFEGNPHIHEKLFLSEKHKGKPPLRKEVHEHA